MSEIKFFVSYFVAPQIKNVLPAENNIHSLFPHSNANKLLEIQCNAVKEYLHTQSGAEIVQSFTENLENKRTSKWPQLDNAIQICKERNAKLVIAELGTMTNNESFAKKLIISGVDFYCCDQPFVDRLILEALHKHAQVQKKLHGKLIREGLKMTSAKSGNPNAAEVISKVNKPKIDTAIVFAFLLQPIIADYKRRGFSQRQMVKSLNEEGFTAPEGGRWVLSQLQKVLDRVRLNELAYDNRVLLAELKDQDLSDAQIASELSLKGICSLKRSSWDEPQVKKLYTRLEQIQDIEAINNFVLNLLPALHKWQASNTGSKEILQQFADSGTKINQSIPL